jgi:hypothetical protein
MKEIDFQFYNSYDEVSMPFYDWERQVINLGCNYSDIETGTPGRKLNGEEQKQFSKLVHEYIHFLQNFATGWGAPVYTDFALSTMKIGASSAESREILTPPLEIADIRNAQLIEGINLRETVVKRVNKGERFEFIAGGTLSRLTSVEPNESIVVLSNGRVLTSLGIKVIRENMAHMGTLLFLGKSDKEIHAYNKAIMGFTKDGIEFSEQSEYWIVFEYFYELDRFDDLARGIFHLMQQCLITLNPELALLRFFKWFEKHQGDYTGKLSFVKVAEDWVHDGDEIYFLHIGFTKSVEHCENILSLTKRHLGEHDLFLFTHNITEYALNNIKGTTGGRFLFNPKDDFTDVNYWKGKILSFGTGLVRYLDGVKIHGTDNHCRGMEDSFTYQMACSLVIKKILDNQKSMCPFLEDIPICAASHKGAANCIKNPFLITQADGSGKSCLFRNGVLLTGMQDRVVFGS